jgi:hypothetical protein
LEDPPRFVAGRAHDQNATGDCEDEIEAAEGPEDVVRDLVRQEDRRCFLARVLIEPPKSLCFGVGHSVPPSEAHT